MNEGDSLDESIVYFDADIETPFDFGEITTLDNQSVVEGIKETIYTYVVGFWMSLTVLLYTTWMLLGGWHWDIHHKLEIAVILYSTIFITVWVGSFIHNTISYAGHYTGVELPFENYSSLRTILIDMFRGIIFTPLWLFVLPIWFTGESLPTILSNLTPEIAYYEVQTLVTVDMNSMISSATSLIFGSGPMILGLSFFGAMGIMLHVEKSIKETEYDSGVLYHIMPVGWFNIQRQGVEKPVISYIPHILFGVAALLLSNSPFILLLTDVSGAVIVVGLTAFRSRGLLLSPRAVLQRWDVDFESDDSSIGFDENHTNWVNDFKKFNREKLPNKWVQMLFGTDPLPQNSISYVPLRTPLNFRIGKTTGIFPGTETVVVESEWDTFLSKLNPDESEGSTVVGVHEGSLVTQHIKSETVPEGGEIKHGRSVSLVNDQLQTLIDETAATDGQKIKVYIDPSDRITIETNDSTITALHSMDLHVSRAIDDATDEMLEYVREQYPNAVVPER